MIELTENNKDYLFRVSKFIKEKVLIEEKTLTQLTQDCGKFAYGLVDDDVIEEEYVDELKDSLLKIMVIMIDNPKREKFE
jgi:hypothetical protein